MGISILTKIRPTEFWNSMAVKVKVAVMTAALPVAWTMRMRTARATNSHPGRKYCRNLQRCDEDTEVGFL